MNKVIKYLAKKKFGDFSMFTFAVIMIALQNVSGLTWFLCALVGAVVLALVDGLENYIHERDSEKSS